PYSIFANTAGNLMGTLPANQLSGTYSNQVNFNNGLYNNFNGAFAGNGSGLTNLASLVPNISVFTTNGTFVVPTNGTKIMVELWGAGGGGGNGYSNISTY